MPKTIYLELKKRAIEEGRPVKELLIEAIIEYLSKPKRKGRRERLIELITTSHPGGSPEDYVEYGYKDVGE